MSESKVRVVKIDKTEYRRVFEEREVEDILRKHAMIEAGVTFEPQRDKSRLYVNSKDGSTGPYRLYEMTVTREDGELKP